MGDSDPKVRLGKDTLRTTYGKDRVDNAIFISETIQEALIEEEALFNKHANCDDEIDLNKEYVIKKNDGDSSGKDFQSYLLN